MSADTTAWRLGSNASAGDPLEAAIRALSDADGLYLLVDPALADRVVDVPEFQALPRQVLPINTLTADRRPYLLSLGSAARNERALNASLRLSFDEARGLLDTESGQPRSVCAWLILRDRNTPPPIAALAQSATARPPHWATVTFRFWDPRVMEHLPRALGTAHVGAWLGSLGIAQWWSVVAQPDSGYSLACLEARADVSRDQQRPRTLMGAADRDQWRLLNAIGWANRLATIVSNWELADSPNHDELERLAHRAMAWGLNDDADVLRFSHCTLTLHPAFDTHPKVASVLKQLQLSDQPGFAELVQSWDDAFLDELRSGAWINPLSMPAQALVASE
ncbi:hypothetical protein [Niveibacterium sp.]|uniref:hypothetical protein n=1 Tax=Niveibacterium sp. TaxID=2017444 RepID=UPI0035B23874